MWLHDSMLPFSDFGKLWPYLNIPADVSGSHVFQGSLAPVLRFTNSECPNVHDA